MKGVTDEKDFLILMKSHQSLLKVIHITFTVFFTKKLPLTKYLALFCVNTLKDAE